MAEHISYAGILSGLGGLPTHDIETSLRSAGLTPNQVRNLAFTYPKGPYVTEDFSDPEAIELDDDDQMYNLSSKDNFPIKRKRSDSTSSDTLRKKERLQKSKDPTNLKLTAGALKRSFQTQLDSFNVQVLSIDPDPERSCHRAVVSDGLHKTQRCFFLCKTLSRITKNKLVVIQIVDYFLRSGSIHIKKYYIIDKKARVVLGSPDWLQEEDTSLGVEIPKHSLDVSLTDVHEQLIDDFLKHETRTRQNSVQSEDRVVKSSEETALQLLKVRWDHCYTNTNYFSALDSIVFFSDSGVIAADPEASFVLEGCPWQDLTFSALDVGAECEL